MWQRCRPLAKGRDDLGDPPGLDCELFALELVKRLLKELHEGAKVLELKERFTEVEVSRALGISKSLVSRYVRGERGRLLDVGRHPIVREAVARIAQAVETGRATARDVEEEIARATVKLLSARALCGLHGKLDKRLDPSSCQLCPRVFGYQAG